VVANARLVVAVDTEVLSRSGRLRAAALVTLLAVAALLRFYALDHDLKRTSPDFDEMHNFVDPILRMWRTGSFDPQVYSGYPGAFNYLAFVPVAMGAKLGGEYGAYVGGRALIAAVGVLTVLLVYLVGRRALGFGPAMMAAALVTVSRADVRSAHHITPDVVVGALGVGLLLAGLTPARARRQAAWGGALSGFATAVKYTGVVLLPAAIVSLIVRQATTGEEAPPPEPALRPRLRRLRLLVRPLGLLLGASALAFAMAAPFAVLARGEHGAGIEHALRHYYGANDDANAFLQGEGSSLAGVASQLEVSVGRLALGLALLGVLFGSPRALTLPAAVLAAATVVAIVPANFLFPRHVVPAVPPLALLAASGLVRVAELVKDPRTRAVMATALGVLALASPAASGLALFRKYLTPSATDQAAEWIERTIDRPAALLAVLPFRLQLDPRRFEVRYARRVEEVGPSAIPYFDGILIAPPKRGSALAERLGWEGRSFGDADGRRDLQVLLRPAGVVPPAAEAPPPIRLSASASPDEAKAAWDGAAATEWRGNEGEAWIEAEWPTPQRLVRVEVVAGSLPRSWPQELDLLYRARVGQDWRDLSSDAIRPLRPARQRQGSSAGQTYVVRGAPEAVALRIRRPAGQPFSLADVRVFVEPAPTSPADVTHRRDR
jgi:hypothetical protein